MAATTTAIATTHPDQRAHRLHRALSGLACFMDGMGDALIQIDRNDLWAIFAVLADEAERLYDEIVAT